MAGYTLGIKTDRQQKLKNARKDICLTPQDFSVKRKKAGVSTNRGRKTRKTECRSSGHHHRWRWQAKSGAKPVRTCQEGCRCHDRMTGPRVSEKNQSWLGISKCRSEPELNPKKGGKGVEFAGFCFFFFWFVPWSYGYRHRLSWHAIERRITWRRCAQSPRQWRQQREQQPRAWRRAPPSSPQQPGRQPRLRRA